MHVPEHVLLVHEPPTPPAQIRVHFALVHWMSSHAASAPLQVMQSEPPPALTFTLSQLSFGPSQSNRHDVDCEQSTVRPSHALPASPSQITRHPMAGGHVMVLGHGLSPLHSMMQRLSTQRVHASGHPASTMGPSFELLSVASDAVPSDVFASRPPPASASCSSSERSSMPMMTPHAKVASASELTTMCRTRTRSA